MKLINALLPLAALTSAFIIPDEQTANQLVIESVKEEESGFFYVRPSGPFRVWQSATSSSPACELSVLGSGVVELPSRHG